VLPYLVPFLIGLSILEDVGYLPRVAFLMDVFMHKIGLHGKSIIPFILGYGCSVPAVMATRILEFPQHRFIVSILATMIPCAARITIIFGLVAFFISPNAALAIFDVASKPSPRKNTNGLSISFLKKDVWMKTLEKGLKFYGFSWSQQILATYEANMKDISPRVGRSHF
jgi:hypothetical protein